MEKTIHITIAKTLFQLEESAYEKLSTYLSSLRAHFASEADHEEIMRDIESRIAEKLLEKKHRLITIDDVTAVIAEIGDSSQFESESADRAEEPAPRAAHGRRKLYRNTDDAIIAGVASGVAAYFNVEPLIVRSLFLVSIFFGGTGIAVYLLLWFLVPEATSASQKLEMRGDRVTLESIKRVVKDRVAETKERGTWKKIIYIPGQIIAAVFRFLVNGVFPLVGKLIGIVFTAGSFFAILGLTAFLSVVAANWDKPYLDPGIRAAIPESLLAFSAGAGYVLILIPLIFILLLGFRLVRGKSAIGSGIGFGLVGIWCLAVIASGAAATRIAGDYYAYTSTNPDYQQTTRTLDVAIFENITIDNAHITLRHGDTQSVSLEGRQMDMDDVIVEVKDGTLSVSPHAATSTCVILCQRSLPSVVITSPNIKSIEMDGGYAFLDEFASTDLAIKMKNGSVSGKISTESLALDLENASLRASIETKTLSIDGASSYFELKGTADAGTITLLHSSLSGERLSITDATVKADSSYVQLGEVTTLHLKDDDSTVFYKGSPEVTEI